MINSSSKTCCDPNDTSKVWYQDKLLLTAILCAVVSIISYFFTGTKEISVITYGYLKIMILPLLLGLFVGGIIECYLPKEFVEFYLARPKKRTLLYALGLGLVMSVCSHGILAIAMALYKKKASVPAVITFLLAAPWSSMPITFLLVSFFGIKAFLLISVALIIAFVTGLIFYWLEVNNMVESSLPIDTNTTFSLREDIKKRIKNYSFSITQLKKDSIIISKSIGSLARMVMPWIIIGMLIASVMAHVVPHHWFDHYLGTSLRGLLFTLGLATVIEICSEGTSPLAFELYSKTGGFGNVMVFLLAGVATDYTEIGLIYKTIGWRAAIWLPVLTVPQILLFGYLANINI